MTIESQVALDAQAPTPLYLQLEGVLKREIERGRWKPGEALPPEREMASLLGVSRITLRRALDLLEQQHILVRRQGSGTFLSKRIEQPLSNLTSFSEEMRARGLEPGSKLVYQDQGPADPQELFTLALSPGSQVVRIVRVRTAGAEPMAIERATVPAWALPNKLWPKGSLYATLEQAGLKPARALQRLRAVLAEPADAELLGVEVGSALLYTERIAYLEDGRPVEVTRSHYRGDLYEFVAELRRLP
jgi:GntR family transcriptional regulator